MATVTIGSTPYDVYQSVAAVDAYAAGSVGDGAKAWAALDAGDKPPFLVSATRILDRQAWAGTLTADGQLHAWPRTGLTYPDGRAVDPTAVPQQVLDAFSEISLSLAAGSTLQDQVNGATTTKRLKAGSAEIEYFRAQLTDLSRFPLAVMELLGWWLGGAGSLGAESTGTDECSHFGDHRFEPSRPV